MKALNRSLLVSAKVAALAILLMSCAHTAEIAQAPAAETAQPAKAPEKSATAQPAANTAAGDLATCSTITVSGPTDVCPPWQQERLCQPKEFIATNGVLKTQLVVAKRYQCVPAGSGTNWTVAPKLLRNYGTFYDGQMRYTFPAPTFRMTRRASRTSPTQGDRFKMLLTNSLGATTVQDQMKCDPNPRFRRDQPPNCFHGNETTNFHFHGFHVSPQPLQDYVLLKLYPEQTECPPNTPCPPKYQSTMTNEQLRHLTSISGSYRYDVDPLPYNQPEGTHWYHAHHHGATAMQVINGMAGTFLIDGPFDKWLNDLYGYLPSGEPKLKDRLLVVQQINDQLATTTPLVNGQGNPEVPIAPGEIQRWRFVSATTQASAQLNVYLPPGFRACQIQMDGIQFSPENYRRQPLLEGLVPGQPDLPCRAGRNFVLSPGNRGDFLVQAPARTAAAMAPGARFEVKQRVVGNVGLEAIEKIQVQRNIARKTGPAMSAATEVPLMTIVLDEAAVDTMGFPRNLPPLPDFLRPPKPQRTKQLAYQMYGASASNPAPVFKIDGLQVPKDPCVPAKMTVARGTDERWIVRNLLDDEPSTSNGGIAHPFHIHTNPFYVVRNGNQVYTDSSQGFQDGIWQDTIALPLATDADPNKQQATSVDLFMEFEDYTGGYVQHCHILGHEDRGMMTLVQTLCENAPNYGAPVAGGPDNCGIQRQPLPICSP